jgi:hypothetical protein
MIWKENLRKRDLNMKNKSEVQGEEREVREVTIMTEAE